MKSILSILNELSNTTSRLEKESILERERDNSLLKETFRLAFDPLTQFYIKKIQKGEGSILSDVNTLEKAYECLLNDFATRKYTGNTAKRYLSNIHASLNADDQVVLERVIGRDPRCGVNTSTINKIWSNLVPDFGVMLSAKITDVDLSKLKWPQYIEKKSDGARTIAVVSPNGTKYFSRNGKPILLTDEFINIKMNNTGEVFVLDGELVAVKNGVEQSRTYGNGLVNKAVKGTISEEEASELFFFVWDCIRYDDWIKGKSPVKYSLRRQFLSYTILNTQTNKFIELEQKEVNSLEEVLNHFKQARSKGWEGVMLKSPEGLWEAKRVKHQIKFKGIYDGDLFCIGWEEGTGKNTGKLGAAIISTKCGECVTRVGIGFSDEDREDPQAIVGKILAIQFNDIVADKRTGKPSLFLPRVIEIREDKTSLEEADTLEDLRAIIASNPTNIETDE